MGQQRRGRRRGEGEAKGQAQPPRCRHRGVVSAAERPQQRVHLDRWRGRVLVHGRSCQRARRRAPRSSPGPVVVVLVVWQRCSPGKCNSGHEHRRKCRRRRRRRPCCRRCCRRRRPGPGGAQPPLLRVPVGGRVHPLEFHRPRDVRARLQGTVPHHGANLRLEAGQNRAGMRQSGLPCDGAAGGQHFARVAAPQHCPCAGNGRGHDHRQGTTTTMCLTPLFRVFGLLTHPLSPSLCLRRFSWSWSSAGWT